MALKNGATMVGDWIVVTTNDPTGSGLRLGIARPVGDSLSEIRRTAGRNAALGLLFIGLAIVGIVPLSGGLTRNLSTLTEGVTRIAKGDYGARVPLKSKDEIGKLAVGVQSDGGASRAASARHRRAGAIEARARAGAADSERDAAERSRSRWG